jgi:SAM-dependent methyltransferase
MLLRASANRVYGEASFELSRAELGVVDRALMGGVVEDVRRAPLGGVDYLLVDTSTALDARHLALLANLSALHALFEVVDGALLRPCPVAPVAFATDDVVTIQRYSGKSNEAFTHLLVNLALAEGERGFDALLAGERLSLLDPACGRGTTLNRGVVYGLDATGIEVDQRDVEAYTAFILTWLKDKRMKHELKQAKLRKGRDTPAHRVTVTYGPTKDRRQHRVVDVIHDDTLNARAHLPARSMDLLVCDLPYGVQHGAQPGAGRLDRGPGGLLARALPVWLDVLRPGGAMALAWNRRTLGRPALAELVADAGFELRTAVDDDGFAHRVDRAIHRDVLLAVRPIR